MMEVALSIKTSKYTQSLAAIFDWLSERLWLWWSLQRLNDSNIYPTVGWWIFHEVREWEDNDHLIFLLMLPSVFRDHLSMLIMLLLLMDIENFSDMRVYRGYILLSHSVPTQPLLGQPGWWFPSIGVEERIKTECRKSVCVWEKERESYFRIE